MQKRLLKFQVVLMVVLCAWQVKGADSQQLLQRADSLYEQKKFTEAKELYFNLFQAGWQSPATLLKMAHVHEGLGEFGEALFFLSEYYKQTEDNRAYEKIITMANAQNMPGFELNPLQRATIWLNNRLLNFLPALAVASIFFMALMLYNSRRGNKSGQYASGFVSILCVTTAGLVLNFFTPSKNAVITHTGYFMSGPSSASNLLTIIPKGNKIEVKGYSDVWAEVTWDGQNGFIRKADFLEARQ